MDRSLVVKIESGIGNFHNIMEYEAWKWLKGTPRSKWLAPCMDISACGAILIQKRTTPLRKKDRPSCIPKFLTDVKLENFGYLDDRVVCIDYGTILEGVRDARPGTIRADWK